MKIIRLNLVWASQALKFTSSIDGRANNIQYSPEMNAFLVNRSILIPAAGVKEAIIEEDEQQQPKKQKTKQPLPEKE